MSLLIRERKKKKHKYPRANHRNYHISRRLKKRKRKLKRSGWKLGYPHLFELKEDFPYIVKRVD